MRDTKAHELGSREIQPEHLLLALFSDSDLFRRVLKGVSVEDLREEVLAQALADCLEELGEMETAKKYAMKCYERGLAMEGVLGNCIIELLEKRFPDIKPSAS